MSTETSNRKVVANITLSLDGRVSGSGGEHDMSSIVPERTQPGFKYGYDKRDFGEEGTARAASSARPSSTSSPTAGRAAAASRSARPAISPSKAST